MDVQKLINFGQRVSIIWLSLVESGERWADRNTQLNNEIPKKKLCSLYTLCKTYKSSCQMWSSNSRSQHINRYQNSFQTANRLDAHARIVHDITGCSLLKQQSVKPIWVSSYLYLLCSNDFSNRMFSLIVPLWSHGCWVTNPKPVK
jgi:hypothetical protein